MAVTLQHQRDSGSKYETISSVPFVAKVGLFPLFPFCRSRRGLKGEPRCGTDLVSLLKSVPGMPTLAPHILQPHGRRRPQGREQGQKGQRRAVEHDQGLEDCHRLSGFDEQLLCLGLHWLPDGQLGTQPAAFYHSKPAPRLDRFLMTWLMIAFPFLI